MVTESFAAAAVLAAAARVLRQLRGLLTAATSFLRELRGLLRVAQGVRNQHSPPKRKIAPSTAPKRSTKPALTRGKIGVVCTAKRPRK
jgi:hypothetical protein